MSQSFIMNNRRTAARSLYCTRSTRLGALRECVKKVYNLTTPTHISFKQHIPISQGLVTSAASVLFFLFKYSYPVYESLLVSAKTSSANESTNRRKPVFQKIERNEVKCFPNKENMILKSFVVIKSI